MARKFSENFTKAQKCITQIVTQWNRTTLSDIELWGLEAQLIHGVFHYALYVLNEKEYNALKEWTEEEYGFRGFGSGSYDYEGDED